uniref:Uncharacterized protein n=1 Tax=Anguilla anguilla TaxID=7936 RepID=A0A0E9THP5_ANGAN
MRILNGTLSGDLTSRFVCQSINIHQSI